MYAPTTQQQLARAYAPDLTPHGALKRLSRWIKQCPPLLKALKKTGYLETQKKISGYQKWLICKYLGAP